MDRNNRKLKILYIYIKTKRIRQKEQRDQAEEERRYIEKWDQTDSPEILNRGEIEEIPGLPSGGSGDHHSERRRI